MSDLISREKLLDTLGKLVIEYDISPHWDDTRTERQKATDHAELVIACIKELVSDQPTIDAVPVRHGKWILVHEADETGNATYECSICHRGEVHVPIVEVGYCWHCGAKMDGGRPDA